ncbi:interleukin-22 receptor subunit alpha-1 [Pelodytes ibericus]
MDVAVPLISTVLPLRKLTTDDAAALEGPIIITEFASTLKNSNSEHVCTGCKDFSSQNVTFNSINFVYILQWDHMDLDSDVMFSVQYKRYGNKEWTMKQECQNITKLYCNLTNEIIGNVEKFKEQYFGRVRASSINCVSDWVMSKRFNPTEDTYIGQLKLNIIKQIHSITIVVQVPSMPSYNNGSQLQTTEKLYSDGLFEYHMSLSRMEEQEIWKKTQINNTFEVTGLNSDTKYNGSVYIMINNQRKSDIKKFEVKTLQDPSLVSLLVCVFAIFTSLLVAVLLYRSYRYVKQQVPTPNSLDFRKAASIQVLYQSLDRVNNLHPMHSLQTFSAHQAEQKFHKPLVLPQTIGQVVYRTQFQNQSTTELSPSSYFPQKEVPMINNNKMDSSVDDYGMFQDRTAYKIKHIFSPTSTKDCKPFSYHTQMEQNFHHTVEPLNSEDVARKESEEHESQLTLELEKNDKFNLLASFDIDSYRAQTLLSTVEVCDIFGLERTVKQDEELKAILLSERSESDVLSHDNEEQVRDSLLQCLSKHMYSFQNPLKSDGTNSLENTWACEQPYKLQCHEPKCKTLPEA